MALSCEYFSFLLIIQELEPKTFKHMGLPCVYSHSLLVVKNLPANAGDTRNTGSIPGLGRSSGIGNGNPLQYSCLENPMDRETQWATVHEAAESWTCTHTTFKHKVTFLRKENNQKTPRMKQKSDCFCQNDINQCVLLNKP